MAAESRGRLLTRYLASGRCCRLHRRSHHRLPLLVILILSLRRSMNQGVRCSKSQDVASKEVDRVSGSVVGRREIRQSSAADRPSLDSPLPLVPHRHSPP